MTRAAAYETPTKLLDLNFVLFIGAHVTQRPSTEDNTSLSFYRVLEGVTPPINNGRSARYSRPFRRSISPGSRLTYKPATFLLRNFYIILQIAVALCRL